VLIRIGAGGVPRKAGLVVASHGIVVFFVWLFFAVAIWAWFWLLLRGTLVGQILL